MKVNGLAGRGRRLLAAGIDAVLVPLLAIVLVMATEVVEDPEDYRNNLWMLWVLLLAISSYLLLNGYTLWRSGQTLGKKAMGIAVVAAGSDLQGPLQPAPFWKLVLLRGWFFAALFMIIVPPLSLLPLIDQLFIFGRQRRCLHDMLCGTMVARVQQ